MRIISIALSMVLFASVFCLSGACYNHNMSSPVEERSSVFNLTPDEIFIPGVTAENGTREHYCLEKSIVTADDQVEVLQKYNLNADQMVPNSLRRQEFSLVHTAMPDNRSILSLTRRSGSSPLRLNLSNKEYGHLHGLASMIDGNDIKQLKMTRSRVGRSRNEKYNISEFTVNNSIIILNH